MISTIDLALDKCQRARLVLKGYEIQKETNLIEKNDEELSIRIIAEYIDQAISSLSMQAPNLYHTHCIEDDSKVAAETTATQNSFAARLRLALAHSGMKQADLAEWLGVSQGTISSYVTGRVKEAGVTRARLMAQALKVRAVWLIHGEGEMSLASNFSNHSDEV